MALSKTRAMQRGSHARRVRPCAGCTWRSRLSHGRIRAVFSCGISLERSPQRLRVDRVLQRHSALLTLASAVPQSADASDRSGVCNCARATPHRCALAAPFLAANTKIAIAVSRLWLRCYFPRAYENHGVRDEALRTTPRRQRRRGYEFAAQDFTHSIGSRIGDRFVDRHRSRAAGVADRRRGCSCVRGCRTLGRQSCRDRTGAGRTEPWPR